MRWFRDTNYNRCILRIILHGTVLLFGVMLGAVTQKTIGFGNVLRSMGIPYPTTIPPTISNISPVVEIPQTHQGQVRLFILAGQSNMVGWAPIPSDEQSDPRIYVFSSDYHWRIAGEPIFNAFNQVDQVSENRFAGLGPAMGFAFASLERNPELVIGLIPCAKNSSGIIQWQRDLSDQSLYGSCLKRVLAASPIGDISGILFFQGETDAADPIQYPEPEPHPAEWSQLFTTFVTDFRNDLGEPDLPTVYAQLGIDPATDAFQNWSVVKEQQASINLNRTVMIITDDLPLMDGLHFTTDSYRIIGRRFAEAYWRLVEGP